jgi:hypothetical protein
MFLCRLHLGEEGPERDHVWIDDMKYYVVKQRDAMMQALPMYVVEFEQDGGWGRDSENAALSSRLDALAKANTKMVGSARWRPLRQQPRAMRTAASCNGSTG